MTPAAHDDAGACVKVEKPLRRRDSVGACNRCSAAAWWRARGGGGGGGGGGVQVVVGDGGVQAAAAVVQRRLHRDAVYRDTMTPAPAWR